MSYITVLAYPEHFTLETLLSTLNGFKMPYVVSPLHSPEGRKPHYHIIFDNSETEYNADLLHTFCHILKTPNNDFRVVKNIRQCELYLLHQTADSANKQQFTKEEICSFGLGYELHKATYQGSRDEVTQLLTYISTNLVEHCRSMSGVKLLDLWDLVSKPDFYTGFDLPIPIKTCISKGLNEVRVHFRFYQSCCQETDDLVNTIEKASDMADDKEVKDTLTQYVLDTVKNIPDNMMSRLLFDFYGNNKKLRGTIKECGGLSNPRETLNVFLRGSRDISTIQALVHIVDKYSFGTSL